MGVGSRLRLVACCRRLRRRVRCFERSRYRSRTPPAPVARSQARRSETTWLDHLYSQNPADAARRRSSQRATARPRALPLIHADAAGSGRTTRAREGGAEGLRHPGPVAAPAIVEVAESLPGPEPDRRSGRRAELHGARGVRSAARRARQRRSGRAPRIAALDWQAEGPGAARRSAPWSRCSIERMRRMPMPGVRTVAATYLGIIHDGGADAVRALIDGIEGSGRRRAPHVGGGAGVVRRGCGDRPSRRSERRRATRSRRRARSGVTLVKLQPGSSAGFSARPAALRQSRLRGEATEILGAALQAASLRQIGSSAAFAAEPLDQRLQDRGTIDRSVRRARDRRPPTVRRARRGPRRDPDGSSMATRSFSEPLGSQPSSAVDDDARAARACVSARSASAAASKDGEPRLQILDLPLRVLRFRLEPLDAGRAGRRQHRQEADARGHRVPERAVAAQRAHAAEELDARSAAKPLGRSRRAIIPIAPVRATCVPPHAEMSKSSHLDQSQRPVRADSFRSGSVGGFVGARRNGSLTGRSSQTIRFASSSARSMSCSRHGPTEIDRGRHGAEVKALGPRAGDTIERRRQHVLPRVLLHVLEAPRPVDRGRGPVPRASSPFDDVQDRAVVVVHHVDDR